MPRYTATIRHHSIASAPEVEITGTLAQAKRAATARFGAGFRDHEIALHERYDAGHYYEDRLIATRVIGERRWIDRG
jgi:hypothetical protein